MMKAKLKLDYTKIPAGHEFTIRAMLVLEGEEEAGAAPRRQLNLSLVLDKSGSMSGMKLERVKEASSLLASKLDERDLLSLTLFDSGVRTVFGPQPMGEGIDRFQQVLRGVSAGSNTFLSGGYMEGCECARRNLADGRVTRVVLLTDGQANEGITDIRDLAGLAGRMLEDGISTSTIGVGDGFNEELIAGMAESGGGSTYYMTEAAEAESIFGEELGDLFRQSARSCTVRFSQAGASKSWDCLSTYKRLKGDTFLIGSMAGLQRRVFVIEIRIVPTGEGPVDLGVFDVKAEVPDGEGFRELNISFPVEVQSVGEEAFSRARPDPEVTLEAALLTMSLARSQALQLADRRQWKEAADLLLNCLRGLEHLGIRDPRFLDEAAQLREMAERLRSEGADYYTASARKQAYFSSELTGKGQFDKRAMMEERQARHQRDPRRRPS
jgi:Ca-activated chloride channel homolog